MSTDLFEALGLPVRRCSVGEVEAAYRGAREEWFLRQFDPQWVGEAVDRVRLIDDAYRSLRDPMRQAQAIRDAKRSRQVVYEETPEELLAPSTPAPNRPLIFRDLKRAAENITREQNRSLDAADCRALAHLAHDLGLGFAAASEIAEQVVSHVDPPTSRSVRTKVPSGI